MALVLLTISAVPAFATSRELSSRELPNIVEVVLQINEETGEFSILIEALLAADPVVLDVLTDSAGKQLTVFGPTDDAFIATLEELGISLEDLLGDQELVTRILLYHLTWGRLNAEKVLAREQFRSLMGVVLYQDSGVLTDALGREANIIATDVEAQNGIIHVIDNVVLPGPKNSIVDVALAINAETGEFDILIAALLAAKPSLLEALSGSSGFGQFTVFAPTDEAFENAFEELGIEPEDLLADQKTLTDILLYHVTIGRKTADRVSSMDQIRMLKGGYLDQDSGVLTDNLGRESTIIATDVMADNGIIHVIDTVVLPYLP
jgi:uncharacterized surface protein with fasciclin (FAS1) repeats